MPPGGRGGLRDAKQLPTNLLIGIVWIRESTLERWCKGSPISKTESMQEMSGDGWGVGGMESVGRGDRDYTR